MRILSKFCPSASRVVSRAFSETVSVAVTAMARSMAGAVIVTALMPGAAIAQDRSLWLPDDGHTMLRGYFLQGEDIYALCDQDCSDLDLFLYDRSGLLVDVDNAPDAFPIVTAPYEGTFGLRVTMPSCDHTAGCAVTVSSDYGF